MTRATPVPTGPSRGTVNVDVPLDEIVAENNIREFSGSDEHARSLLQSIRAVGVLEPVLLAPLPVGRAVNGYRWQLIAGFRRYTAACQAGLDRIPARLLKGLSAAEVLEIRLTENLQRLDMNAIEQARALREYISASGCTQDVAGRKMGRTGAWVSSRLGLLRLPEEVQAMIALGKVPTEIGIRLSPHSDLPRAMLVTLARKGAILGAPSWAAELERALAGENPGTAGRKRAVEAASACRCSCSCCIAGRHRSVV